MQPEYPIEPASMPLSPPVTVPAAGPMVPATAAPLASPYGSEPVLVQIAQIQVTATTVHTPAGSFPLRGSTWMVNDRIYPVQKTPTWAIVLAIVGFFCLTLFSLLFLLAKETRYEGVVEVHVANGPHGFTAHIPNVGPPGVQTIHSQVNYARSLAAR